VSRLSDGVIAFCTLVYEETCASPGLIELPPVAFDTLSADLAPSMRRDDGLDGDWPYRPVIMLAVYGGHVCIKRGRA
jgi:hypothetical protein